LERLGKPVFGEKRWGATAIQDASRLRVPGPFAPASWTAPAPWRFGPGQATCARVRMIRYVFCGNAQKTLVRKRRNSPTRIKIIPTVTRSLTRCA
jgi:hypothetical protein